MKISVVGAGMVGFTIGRAFALFGNKVTYFDVNMTRINDLNIAGYKAYHADIKNPDFGEITFVCVPTPTVDKKQVIKHVVSAIESLCDNRQVKVIVIKSTILPGTMRSKLFPILKRNNRTDIKLYHNPEFLTEKNPLYDFLHNRIVIGTELDLYGYHDNDLQKLLSLYTPFKAPKTVVDWETAEMMKYAANMALAHKISYWCEINEICNKLFIDPKIVAEYTGLDKRIGTYGFRPLGMGFCGACLPKDSQAFSTWLTENDIMHTELDMFEPMIRLNNWITGSQK